MENSRSCKSCQKRALVLDDVTDNLVCSLCGVVQDFDNFQAQIGGYSGPVGTNVRVGTAGSGSVYNYRETKIYLAQKLIEELMYKLGLSGSRSIEVKSMVEKITEGEYGQGRWFSVLVGACSYVVMRKDNRMLSIVEIANVIDSDSRELGHMINRVVNFLDTTLPEFDIVKLFERAIACSPSFAGISDDLIGKMLKQGIFLVQCSIKWFLTTGRMPVPIVAAVLVLVAQLNQVQVKLEYVAKELHATVRTCKRRYDELLERLVKVARSLPWGKDVTVKNVMKNAPSIIQYMELKSMSKCNEKSSLESIGIDLNDLVGDCVRKEIIYGSDAFDIEKDAEYFEVEPSHVQRVEDPDNLQLSHECLAMIYSNFLNEVPLINSANRRGDADKTRKKIGFDLHACYEWWTGKSEMSRKLLLKQILDKDIGLNANPPSFDSGQLVYESRREKIKAAKLRIKRVMHPSGSDICDADGICPSKSVKDGKKRRKVEVEIDWEDFIIETLLLHRVSEDEIEKGHYNVLLDLHVFSYLEKAPEGRLMI